MKKKILSIVLTLSLLTGSLLCFPLSANALYYTQGQKIARIIADEGIVLLKNENAALPIKQGGSIALFGEAQRMGPKDEEFWNTHGYIPYGYGSESQAGDFGDHPIDPLDALKDAEKNGELTIYHPTSDSYAAALENRTEYVPTDAEVAAAAAAAETAVVFFSRWGGEAFDVARTDWYLRENETSLLRQLTAAFPKVVVVLNTPSVIDTSWAKDEIDGIHIDSVLYVGYTGMQGGLSIADVLLGRVNPSGKANDTWAKDLTDYPSTAGWNQNDQAYTEDIFVGYRYFETFDPAYTKVNYPFGFGLSYTAFDIQTKDFAFDNDTVTVKADVTNTGSVAGKEVVQMYVSAPQGKLGKAAKALCDYGKTKTLMPGETQTLTLTADLANFASFDDLGKTGNKSCYVLEAGDYRFLVGNSVRDISEAGTAKLDTLRVIQRLSSLCPTNLEKRLLADGSYETLPIRESDQNYVHTETPKANVKTNEVIAGHRLSEVVFGTMTMDDYLAQWSDKELATFFVSYEGNQVGPSDALCAKYGLNRFSQGDGGMGLCFMGTAYPCNAILASTWNDDLAEAFGLLLGTELYKNNVGMWLGPPVNMRRNPLGGRNLEYYSEDPYVTGRFATIIIKAVQRNGIPVCIKHMICNEKEAGKIWSDSQVSERALREIYLKPFEMGIKDGHAEGIMTSYNVMNGLPTSENADLLRGIVRGEWGYEGFITTDWGNAKNQVREINASNNVHTPYDHCDINLIYNAIDSGEITRATLEEGAAQILWTLMRAPRYYRANTCVLPHHYDEYGRCTVCHAPDPAVRTNLSRNLAALVPEAGINTRVPVWFGYPGVSDFIGRNTESFCANIMAVFKYAFNFVVQVIGLMKLNADHLAIADG
ncbi:MAG: glycoside hydrolase family 3 protein [Clostridia bacterium]|nr:glycoside hydrolase family 3 protein [Clostridia bacterium]